MVGLNEVLDVVLPLLVGYVIALAVYMGTTFAIAQFFRSALAAEGRPLPGFYAASAMAWLFATICACYYVVTMAPYPWEIIVMAVSILGVLLLDARDFNTQQPKGLVALCSVVILGSAWIVWKLVS